MTDDILAKLFEHNNWANLQMIAACAGLTEEQLDAAPLAGSDWSIRHTLSHVVAAQLGYLSLLTLPPEARKQPALAFHELRDSVARSGDALLALVGEAAGGPSEIRLRTTDGYLVEPWVVLLQVINHATEHRKQVNLMLRALGAAPQVVDGWAFGEMAGALVPIAT